MEDTSRYEPLAGDVIAAINRSVTRVLAAHTGRGPNKSHAWLRNDEITITLREVHGKGERFLVEHGRADLVEELRRGYFDALRIPLTEAVERETGREVAGLLGDHSASLDLTTITVELEPADRPTPSLHPLPSEPPSPRPRRVAA